MAPTGEEEVAAWRRAKDDFLKADFDSPLPAEEQTSFQGLRYFAYDPSYSIPVKLSRYPNPEIVTMITSKGSPQRFHRVGRFSFSLADRDLQLSAYQSAERQDDHLFVPFKDQTSGRETYGSGRYIDLDVAPDDNYVLDFNRAYNPYCAYSENYVCPLSPRENWLETEVRAGELKYHD